MKNKRGLILALGFQLPVYIFAGLAAGYVVEKNFPFHGLILTFGAFLGVGVWLLYMIRWLKAQEREEAVAQDRGEES